MQVPFINIDVNQKVYNLNYQPARELVIIDPVEYNLDEIGRLGFWNVADFSKRKFVFLFSNSTSSHVQGFLHYLWKVDIIDVIFLVYDDKSRRRYTEVFVSNPHHPSNRCGSVVANVSRLSCDTIKKTRKRKFFRNYNDEWKKSHINLQLLENSSILTGIMNIYSLVKEFQRKIYFIPDETLIRSELMTFGTRPSSYLIQDVNKVISSLRESGLLDYQRLIYKRTQKDYIKYHEQPHSRENVVLGMKHVFPIFLFWGAGMVIATVAFVLEHFTYYIKNR
ncbi:hypothetical protein FQA39_LY18483 [Lamprigera yunnana]|nr:hypothetical protein FQA39_LY18483 [Lamprigera yunnana]